MPCFNPMSDMTAEEVQLFVLKHELNKATDLLCRLCEETEKLGQLPDEHKEWWEKHKAFDAERTKK